MKKLFTCNSNYSDFFPFFSAKQEQKKIVPTKPKKLKVFAFDYDGCLAYERNEKNRIFGSSLREGKYKNVKVVYEDAD